MRTFLWLAVVFSQPVFAGTLQLDSRGGDFTLNWKLASEDLAFQEITAGRETYLKIPIAEGLNQGFETTPDIPRFHRWLIVSPEKKYEIKVELSGAREFSSFLLAPVAKDALEGEVPELTVGPSYAADKWVGSEGAVLGERVQLGNLTLLPVTLTPFQYNPARRKLRVYEQVRVILTAEGEGSDAVIAEGEKITPFVLAQAEALTLNGAELLRNAYEVGGIHVIVTNDDLLSYAQELGKLHHPMLHDVRYEVIPKGLTSTQLRQRLLDNYPVDKLSSILFFGDEGRIPLHQWSSGMPGDWYYALLKGSDSVADVGLGRLPVTDQAEAAIVVRRTKAYYELAGNGQTSRKVMLVAHKENFPGKYTANQEVIRKSPNPRNFDFTTVYGGNQGSNDDVLRDAVNGFALINYRGHGSNTTWSSWGADGKSFNLSDADQLYSQDQNLSVVFNIACNNGAIHASTDSLSERMLFPAGSQSAGGVVAALGSTIESYTATNDRFDIHLFDYLQTGQSLALGDVLAYANNKLVQESNGTLPYNSKIYILFGDPLLAPWLPL